MSENKIQPRKLEFKQYDDSYETEQTEMVVTADFNMNTVAKTILEDRKYSHAEIESVLTYFNGLYIAAKSNDKEDTNGI